MDAFKVLHILSMFAAVTLLVGEALLYARAIWRSDVAGLAAVRRLLGGRPLLGVSFFIAGIVFGLLAAVTGGFEFFAGWLIAAYADCGAVRRQWIAACAEAAADRGRGDGGNGRRAIARRGRRLNDERASTRSRRRDPQHRALRSDHHGHDRQAL